MLPQKGSKDVAGHNITCAEGNEVPVNEKLIVSTNLVVAVPKGTYGWIALCSGLATKHHIQVGTGVINQDYWGHVKVMLFNHSKESFQFKKSDYVDQLIL